MDFTTVIKLHVQEPDVDIMGRFAEAISNRFAGTAIRIDNITTTRDEEAPA